MWALIGLSNKNWWFFCVLPCWGETTTHCLPVRVVMAGSHEVFLDLPFEIGFGVRVPTELLTPLVVQLNRCAWLVKSLEVGQIYRLPVSFSVQGHSLIYRLDFSLWVHDSRPAGWQKKSVQMSVQYSINLKGCACAGFGLVSKYYMNL